MSLREIYNRPAAMKTSQISGTRMRMSSHYGEGLLGCDVEWTH